MVAYWRKRVAILMTNTPQDNLATARARSGLAEEETLFHARVGLRKSYQNLGRVKREFVSKFQTQLEELAEALEE